MSTQVGYRCPFCRSGRTAKPKRRRTMAGNVIWGALFIGLFAGLGVILTTVGRSGDMTSTLVAIGIFVPLFLGGLVAADRLCTEWQTRCPDCKRKVD
jgi:CHASE2 domain-containing sensor protein